MAEGVIIRLDSAACIVLCEGASVRCPLPGKWRRRKHNQTRPMAVGDRVKLVVAAAGDGAIEQILPRQGGKLSRKAAGDRDIEQVVAANVDQLVVVMAAAEPELNRRLLDRLVVSGEYGDLEVAVCINKLDLVEAAAVEPVLAVYRRLGYAAIATSAVTGAGVDAWRLLLKDKTSVFAGPSGVGKSALLMAVQPGLALRVGEVSAATGKGRHTTTAVSLLPLAIGGYVVDTPGIREFALYDVERAELQHCFPEIAERFGQCHFADCSHVHEPGCAVAAAVQEGAIDAERYESYCRILDGLPLPNPSRRRR